jgi:hypothetical protein
MVMLRPRSILGAILAILGLMVALNGLVSGPRAFWQGWSSVVGSLVAGLLLFAAGILIRRGY